MHATNKILISITFLLSGCFFDSDFDTITNDYKTGWIDIPQTRNISKGEEIVPAYVSAIGFNSKYIIAKQHPVKRENIITVNSDTVNYYIIEISSNSYQDRPVHGPLNEAAFDSLRRLLNIAHINFKMHYPE